MKLTRAMVLIGAAISGSQALAAPPVWEHAIGRPLTGLSGADDAHEAVVLGFGFPFGGVPYTDLFVGNNGCVQLGSLGADGAIPHLLSQDFGGFYADGAPMLCPFGSDLDQTTTGTVHVSDFGDRAVITWDEVGTDAAEAHLLRFQLQLLADGTIIFAYDGILNGMGESMASLGSGGIVVGVSSGDGTLSSPEASNNLTVGAGVTSTTFYERWCGASADTCGPATPPIWKGDRNRAFDLDNSNIIWVPDAHGGFEVLASAGTTAAGAGLWERQIGHPIEALSGEDEMTHPVALGFGFPFAGTDYTNVHVGTNGCLQLGSLGSDRDISYELWWNFHQFYFDDDAVGAPEPILCPLGADLDLLSNGAVHFADHGDRAVFTWNEVGTFGQPTHLSSFQAVLHADGRIVFTWNGIVDDEGESPLYSINGGIVAGISRSDGSFLTPADNPFDLDAQFAAGHTVYQRWCGQIADSCGAGELATGWMGPLNDAFHLDRRSVVFTPTPIGFESWSHAPVFRGGFEH